ncbi:MAG: carboxypeptidase-like regulatory domain-containing protein [Methanosarcinales archaeon]
MNSFYYISAMLLALLLLIGVTSAQNNAEISGQLISDKGAIPNQKITLSKMLRENLLEIGKVHTDNNGFWNFTDLDVGQNYLVNITYRGATYREVVYTVSGLNLINFNLTGAIKGKVKHKNGTDISGVLVTLKDNLDIDIDSIVFNTTTDEFGNYSFENININKGYVVEVIFQNTPYLKFVMVLNNTTTNLNFEVYDSTTESNDLEIVLDHIILTQDFNGLSVTEAVIWENTGDKVFFDPEQQSFLGISTPIGIQNFQTLVMECCVQQKEGEVWINPMDPIMPDSMYQTKISYSLKPEGSDYVFNKYVFYNTTAISILASKESGLTLESESAQKESIYIQDREYEVLTFRNLKKGSSINAKITDLTKSKIIYNTTASSNQTQYFVAIIIGLLIIIAIAFPFIKTKYLSGSSQTKREIIEEEEEEIEPESEASEEIQKVQAEEHKPYIPQKQYGEVKELESEKNLIFEQIMKIEKEYKDGALKEDEYLLLKKEYEQRAIKILKKLRDARHDKNL